MGRDLQYELTQRGLTIIGLHFATLPCDSSLSWPSSLSGRKKLLEDWASSRPAAARLVELALTGQPMAIVACEGLSAAFTVSAAVNALSPTDSLETYVSPSASEAASDVSHLFDRLFSARHYIVPGED